MTYGRVNPAVRIELDDLEFAPHHSEAGDLLTSVVSSSGGGALPGWDSLAPKPVGPLPGLRAFMCLAVWAVGSLVFGSFLLALSLFKADTT